MKTAIVYRSRYGATAACAAELAGLLHEGAELVDVAGNTPRALDQFECIVVGAPVYGGKIPSGVRRFCERRRAALLSKRIGLFICCLYDGERADAQLESNYPAWLRAHAAAESWFGGSVTVSDLNLVDRFLFKRVAGMDEDIDRIHHGKITEFAHRLQEL